MKKKVFIISFSIILFIFIFLSLVSANGYSDNTPIPNSVYCSDSDRGVYSTMKGTVTVSGKNYTDNCYTNGTVYEYYCSGTTYSNSYINCPSGYNCSSGVCIYSPPVAEKLNISVATLKDTYKVGEAINLTDPPDEAASNEGITGNIIVSKSKTDSIDTTRSDAYFTIKGESVVKTIRDGDGTVRSVKDNNGITRYVDFADGIAGKRVINENGEFISQEDAELLKPNGYIVEFIEEPTIKQYVKSKEKYKIKTKKEALEKKRVIKKATDLQKVKINKEHVRLKTAIASELGATLNDGNIGTTSKISGKVIEDNMEGSSFLEKLWDKIVSLFGKKSVTGEAIISKSSQPSATPGLPSTTSSSSPSTSPSTSSKKEIEVLGEWDSVFNGIALNISTEESEKIKKIPGVKAVHPNYKVKTMLQDSVPLIGADKVWQGESVKAQEISQTISIYDKEVKLSLNNQIYTVKLESISSTGIATLTINNIRKSMKKGESYKLIEATLYVDDVQYIKYKEDGIWYDDSFVSIRLKSDKPSISGYTGKGVTIAIIDTGVDYTHPDLGECTKETFLAGKCEKVIGGYDFINNDDDPMDDQGHGTHVAATATGKGDYNNNNIYEPQLGEVWGVAPDAKIVAYKVLGADGRGNWDGIISAIDKVADPNGDGDYSDHFDIISMSLGGDGNPDDLISKAVDNAVDAGVVAVIAAGNSGPDEQTIGSPGTARKAITVGAVYNKDYQGNYWNDWDPKKDQITSFSSSGPVIWNDENGTERNLIKPDIVAPGAFICAAKLKGFEPWNHNPNYKKCINDNHVLLAGTSMATPITSGGVALIKQAHPDWTPDEIKMVLRNSAKDLYRALTSQGYGRIDMTKSITSDKPPIALVSTSGDVDGIVKILGTAKGSEFKNYTIEYSKGDERWFVIYSSKVSVDNNILASWDTTDLNDGKYLLRLIVSDSDGLMSEDQSIITINNFEILSIGTNNYIKDIANIRGVIRTSDNSRYKISYNKYSNDNWNEICNSDAVHGEFSCMANTTNISNGKYLFKLSILRNGKWLDDISVEAIVIHELMDNWPVELGCSSRGPIVSADLDKDGKEEIINTYSNYCSFQGIWGESSSLTNISIFKSDASYKSLVFSYTSPPSVIDGQMVIGYQIFGLVDSQFGNFIKGWPIYLDGWIIGPTLIIKDNIFIRTHYYNNISLIGFDKTGKILKNFPIEIKNDAGFKDWITPTTMVAVDNGTDTNIGFIFVNVNKTNNNMYFYIYSKNGQLLEKSLIFNKSTSEDQSYHGFTNLAVSDLNNDGVSEIGFGFLILDNMLYDKDIYDINAYEGNIYIINLTGEVISNKIIKGYDPYLVSVGNFGRSNSEFIFALSDTFSTTFKGQKLIDVGINGNIFDINLDNYNHIIGGLSIGDIDGDANNSEILVSYRPRWWRGQDSGILVYNSSGFLKKEISIPTLGEAEQLEFGDSPILTDFNGDGKIDIVQKTLFLKEESSTFQWKTHIFVFNLNNSHNSDKIVNWPQFQHDAQHTGCYNCGKIKEKMRPQSKLVNSGTSVVSGKLNISIQQLKELSDYRVIDEGEVINIFRDFVGNLYNIKLIDTNSTTEALIDVDGVQKSVVKGNYYEFSKKNKIDSQLTLYVDDVFHATKKGTLSSVYLNVTSKVWITLVDKSVISYPVTVKGNGGIVKLDALFNPKGFSLSQAGKYRVVANFVSGRGTKVENNWEFGVV